MTTSTGAVTIAIGALGPMGSGDATAVNGVSARVLEQRATWSMATALLGGTNAMRAAKAVYLPKWPMEADDTYESRLAKSTLFPAYRRTVFTLAARPFSKPITVSDNVPASIAALLPNIDLQGNSLDIYESETFRSAMGHGICGTLIDHPVRPPGARTRAEDAALGMRPYFVRVYAEQLLGWRKVVAEDGSVRLAQLRFMESVEEPDGEFGTKFVSQVRVFDRLAAEEPSVLGDNASRPGRVRSRVFRQTSDGGASWAEFSSAVLTLSEIPFVPTYGEYCGFMESRPPLLELAHQNVKHWQQQSDQDNLMHVARVPIIWTRCTGDDFKLVIGAASGVNLGNSPDAMLGFAEHSGAAIAAGKTQLDDLCQEMRQSGAELLVLRPGPATATEVASDNAVGMCALQEMALGAEDAIDQKLQFMAEYLGETDGGNVELFKDFGAATLADASASLLVGLKNSGGLSGETLFNELKRRGMISADVLWDEELERIESEAPDLPAAPGSEP